MNLLLTFDRRHGMLTSLVGSGSGGLSWLLAHAPEVTNIAGAIGAVCTAAIALLALAVKVYGLGCRFAAWARRRRRNRAAWREHFRDTPLDDRLP